MDINRKDIVNFLLQYIYIYFIAIFVLCPNISIAQGDLLIFPKRIVFEGREKVQSVDLINSGKDSVVYNISFEQYRMNEFGNFEKITEPDSGQFFSSQYLSVYPRKVNLAPFESKTVKVQILNTSQLQIGEYRSHLFFRAEKNNIPRGEEKVDTTSLSVRIEPVFGITIPCIIRRGVSNTNVLISALEIEKEGEDLYFLKMQFNRTGNMSCYGDIRVIYISPNNKEYEVGKANGLSVYTPGKLRKVKMQLQKPEGVDFNNGKFKVVYTQNESKKVIAESEVQL